RGRTLRARPWLGLAQRAVQGVRACARLFRPLLAFLRPRPHVSIGTRVRVLLAIVRLFTTLLRHGCKLGPTLRFLQSRHLQSQLLLGECRGPVFLTSMPFTFGQNPWVIEIE